MEDRTAAEVAKPWNIQPSAQTLTCSLKMTEHQHRDLKNEMSSKRFVRTKKIHRKIITKLTMT